MAKYEYLEVDLHGESGCDSTVGSPLGEGHMGYIAKLNVYGAEGWRVVNIDVDTHSHIRVILERDFGDKGDGQ